VDFPPLVAFTGKKIRPQKLGEFMDAQFIGYKNSMARISKS
jgi:hypothetical protein